VSVASIREKVDLGAIERLGTGLQRPECVLANARGDVYTADWRGGVAQLRADGGQALFRGELPDGRPARPNGIALRPDGSFLFADLGAERGGVFALTRDGSIRPFLEEVDGIALPPSNFVVQDAPGRVWITVSTRQVPRALAYRRDVADGFVVLVDGRGARIVADGLGYTNEAILDARGEWLYVNETFARITSRFRVRADGSLGAREVFVEYGPGTYPDGMAFDEEGHLWIVSIISNRVLRVAPDRSIATVVEDSDPGHLAWVEQAYAAGELGRAHLDDVKSARLRNISSIAFGGADRRTAYLGCLLDDCVYAFRSPVAGLAPAHWNWPA
jgi:sugar lactone lactonase YvrE